MTNYTEPDMIASEHIVSNFLARFLPNYDYEPLLLYASLPLILTPELLHYLRHRFVPNIPWVAEVDILLAEELCRERGYEQYTMNTLIRSYLLRRVKQRPDIQIEDAARLMVQYLHAFARTQPYATSADLQAQQWSALAFIKETSAIVAQEIVDAMEEATVQRIGGEPNRPELKRLVALAEQFAPELVNYPEILEHAQRIRNVLTGGTDKQLHVIPSDQPRYRIFLSYTKSDQQFARKLANDLYSHGHNVWIDYESMSTSGSSFTREIRKAIDDSDRFIFIIGAETANSKYAHDEWDHAIATCQPVIAIRRSGHYSPDNLVNPIHLIDMRDDSAYATGLVSITRLLESDVSLGELFGVPLLPLTYVERNNELHRIKLELFGKTDIPALADLDKAQPIVIQGMAGIGKTVTASAICRDCDVRRHFVDGIFWITLGQAPNLLTAMADVGEFLGDAREAYTDHRNSRRRLHQILATKQALIVLDDVWNVEHVAEFRTFDGRNRILVTTRQANIASLLGAQISHQVSLTVREGLELIARRLNQRIEDLPTECSEVVKLLGGHTLALSLVAARLKQDGIASAPRLLLQLRESMTLEHFEAESQQRDSSIKLSLNISYATLSHDLQRRFRATGIFSPEVGFDVDFAREVWGSTNRVQTENALSQLENIGLVISRANRRYVLHPLVRMYAHELLETNNEKNEIFLRYFAYITAQSAQFSTSPPETWEKVDELLPHIDYIVEIVAESLETDDLLMRAARTFASHLANYLEQHHEFDRPRWLQMGLIAAGRQGAKLEEAHFLDQFARRSVRIGELHIALNYYEQALSIRHEIKDLSAEAATLANMGIVFADLGEKRKALRYFEESLSMMNTLGNHSMEAMVTHNIGKVFTNLGNPEKALNYYEQALQLKRALDDRQGEASVLVNIGETARMLDDVKFAKKSYEQALAITRALGNMEAEAKILAALEVLTDQPENVELERQHFSKESLFEQLYLDLEDIQDSNWTTNALFEYIAELCYRAMEPNPRLVTIGLKNADQLRFVASYPSQELAYIQATGYGTLDLSGQTDRIGIPGQAVLAKRTLLVEDLPQDSDYVTTSDSQAGSLLSVLLRDGQNILGVITLESQQKRGFNQELVKFVEHTAVTTVAAMRKAQESRLRRLTALIAAIEMAGAEDIIPFNLQNTLQMAAESTRNIFNADGCLIYLIDTDQPSAITSSNLDAGERVISQKLITSITSHIVRTNLVFTIEDLAHYEPSTLLTKSDFKTEGLKSICGIPMRANNLVVGVLFIQFVSHQMFDDQVIALLQTIADKLASKVVFSSQFIDKRRTLDIPNLTDQLAKVFGSKTRKINLVFYGNQAVGKTTFIESLRPRLKSDNFSFPPATSQTNTTTLEVNRTRLYMTDLAESQLELNALRKYMKTQQDPFIILLCLDILQPRALNQRTSEALFTTLRDSNSESLITVIPVITKADSLTQEQRMQLFPDEKVLVAARTRESAPRVFYVSAITGEGIVELFEKIISYYDN